MRPPVSYGISISLVFSACYGGAHAPPQRPAQPILSADGVAELGTKVTPAHIDEFGHYHDDFTQLTFSYNGEQKSYTEYRAIVDPNWNKTLDEYEHLVKKCRRASIPKYAGVAMIIGGLAFAWYGTALIGENRQQLQIGIAGGSPAQARSPGFLAGCSSAAVRAARPIGCGMEPTPGSRTARTPRFPTSS